MFKTYVSETLLDLISLPLREGLREGDGQQHSNPLLTSPFEGEVGISVICC